MACDLSRDTQRQIHMSHRVKLRAERYDVGGTGQQIGIAAVVCCAAIEAKQIVSDGAEAARVCQVRLRGGGEWATPDSEGKHQAGAMRRRRTQSRPILLRQCMSEG
jgi:hypothetical protein